MDTTFSVQLITVISLLVGSIVFGTLPLFVAKVFGRCGAVEVESSRRYKSATCLLYFGGGVFISNIFLVLLPQARNYLEDQDVHTHENSEEPSGHHHDSFPIPEFIVVCSFFAAYILQELICCIISRFNSTARKSRDLRVRFCSCAKRHTECSRTYKAVRPDQTLFGLDKNLMEYGHASNFTATAPMASGPPEMSETAQPDFLRSSIISQTVPNYGTLTNVSDCHIDSPQPILSSPVLLAEERRLSEQQTAQRDHNQLLVSSLLTATALTLQFLFLGIALGLRTTSPTNWYYFVVVCLQNFILTFSACSDFATHSIELTYVSLNVALLSVISPIGVMVAMFKAESVVEIPQIAKGNVAAIACGVLLYTTFYEVLKKRGQGSVTGLARFSAIMLGTCVMAAVQYAVSTL